MEYRQRTVRITGWIRGYLRKAENRGPTRVLDQKSTGSEEKFLKYPVKDLQRSC
jgi:hypothetical protein